MTQCTPMLFDFQMLGSRDVLGAFDGDKVAAENDVRHDLCLLTVRHIQSEELYQKGGIFFSALVQCTEVGTNGHKHPSVVHLHTAVAKFVEK